MQALILVGGLGTRLGALAPVGGKPMVAVAGRPFLLLLLAQLARSGLTDFLLCGSHRANYIRNCFGDGRRFGVSINYSLEDRPLGTAGAIRHAMARIRGDTFIVSNGDSMVDYSLPALMKLHGDSAAVATMTLAHSHEMGRYGSAALDSARHIIGFFEKDQRARGTGLVNAGVYACHRSLFDWLPDRVPSSLEKDVFPSLLGKGLFGYTARGAFVDIGIPAALRDAQRDPAWILAQAGDVPTVKC